MKGLQVNGLLTSLLDLVSIAAVATAFYLTVERPAHLLSKWLGRLMESAYAPSVQMVTR